MLLSVTSLGRLHLGGCLIKGLFRLFERLFLRRLDSLLL